MRETERLWQEGKLPIEDVFFFADGRSFAVKVVGSTLHVVETLDLAEVLAEDTEQLTSIDITVRFPRRPASSAPARVPMAPKASSPGWTSTGGWSGFATSPSRTVRQAGGRRQRTDRVVHLRRRDSPSTWTNPCSSHTAADFLRLRYSSIGPALRQVVASVRRGCGHPSG